ncbi:hypothetical protein ACFVSW_20050 [Neobacillus sp. NPDC058068]|uniref:hypothetical protein n=1 Tax=Neobacillus sp. NPDC058068 TaxID=3346325 RepID=UPI0036DA73B8
MPRDLTVKARKKRVIACEDLDFVWDEPELDEMANMWESGTSVMSISKHFKARDPDEVFIALFHLAREDKISDRFTKPKGEY